MQTWVVNKIYIPTTILSVLAVAVVFGSASPAFSSSDGESYTRNWVSSIGDAVGTIEVSEDTNVDDVKDQAISEEEATDGYDVTKARLTKAVNDSDQYFLVWKLIEYGETDTVTMYILDAGTGEQLVEPIIKEGGMCGSKQS